MKKIFVVLIAAVLLGSYPAYATASVATVSLGWLDELYDIAKSTLRYTVSKGDDFLNFLRTTSRVDDLILIVSKLPKSKRLGTVLEVCATRNLIKPTEVLKYKGVLNGLDDADSFIFAAVKNGDDIGKTVGSVRYATQNSAVLGKNMTIAGILKPAGNFAAHHMVASDAPMAAIARQVLSKFGIDINDVVNGVWLRTTQVGTGAYHRVIHTGKYYDEVNELLAACKSREEVFAVLNKIRKMLEEGTFPY